MSENEKEMKEKEMKGKENEMRRRMRRE